MIYSVCSNVSLNWSQIRLKVRFSRPISKLTAMEEATSDLYLDDTEEENPPNELQVTVIQGRRMEVRDHSVFAGSTYDPQVRLKVVGFESQTTHHLRKNFNPVWNSKHTFSGVSDPSLSLILTAENFNNLKPATFMGRVAIPLEPLQDKRSVAKWYKLRNKAIEMDGVDRGELEVRVRWVFSKEVNWRFILICTLILICHAHVPLSLRCSMPPRVQRLPTCDLRWVSSRSWAASSPARSTSTANS